MVLRGTVRKDKGLASQSSQLGEPHLELKEGYLNFWLYVARQEKLGRQPSWRVRCLKPEE